MKIWAKIMGVRHTWQNMVFFNLCQREAWMGSVIDWMFVSLQNVYVGILTPTVMVLRDGTFGR